MFSCYLLEACPFLMRDRKGVDLERKGVEVNDVLVLNSDSKIDISIPTEKTG